MKKPSSWSLCFWQKVKCDPFSENDVTKMLMKQHKHDWSCFLWWMWPADADLFSQLWCSTHSHMPTFLAHKYNFKLFHSELDSKCSLWGLDWISQRAPGGLSLLCSLTPANGQPSVVSCFITAVLRLPVLFFGLTADWLQVSGAVGGGGSPLKRAGHASAWPETFLVSKGSLGSFVGFMEDYPNPR